MESEHNTEAEKTLDHTISAIRRYWRKGITNKIAFVNREERKTYTISFGKKRVTAWLTYEKDPGDPMSRARTQKIVFDETLDIVWHSWEHINVFSNGHKIPGCSANDIFYFIQYIEYELRKMYKLKEVIKHSPSSPRAVKAQILEEAAQELRPDSAVDRKHMQFSDILDMVE